jgi:hypothetical protein
VGDDQARNFKIWSVENGVLAFSPDQDPRGNVTSLRVGRSVDNAREFTFGENAEVDDGLRLSPTGAWLSYLLIEFNGPPARDDVRAFALQMRDAGTGESISLQIPQPSYALPVIWLNDTTLQVLVLGPTSTMSTCVLPSGSCAVVATLPPSAVDGTNLVLPNGRSATGN